MTDDATQFAETRSRIKLSYSQLDRRIVVLEHGSIDERSER